MIQSFLPVLSYCLLCNLMMNVEDVFNNQDTALSTFISLIFKI